MELVIDCSKDGTRLSVWNPYTHSWWKFEGVSCGDSRKTGKKPLLQEDALDCELICPGCGCKDMTPLLGHPGLCSYSCGDCQGVFSPREIQDGELRRKREESKDPLVKWPQHGKVEDCSTCGPHPLDQPFGPEGLK